MRPALSTTHLDFSHPWPQVASEVPHIEVLQADLRLRPQTALEVVYEVAASNDLGGRIEVVASSGLKWGP